MNGLYALGWVPIIHARVFKGQHWKWMTQDVAPIIVPTVLAGWLLAMFVPWPAGRWATFAVATTAGAVLLAVAGGGSSVIRSSATVLLARFIARLSKEWV
jgi:hypothetical protein